MNAITFPEVNLEIAKDQPEYNTLPANVDQASGVMTFCWEISDEDLAQIIETRKIWHRVLTGGGPLQPVAMTVTKPEMARA